MKLTPDSDMDFIDLQGSGDKADEAAAVGTEGSDNDSDVDSVGAESSVEDEFDDGSTLPTSVGGEGSVPSWASDNGAGMRKILKAFKMLQTEYNEKFKKMWA
jgi:hypothetical protein